MGAPPPGPGRWQPWHERWRIGATSFVNVTSAADCAAAGAAPGSTAPVSPLTRRMRPTLWRREAMASGKPGRDGPRIGNG